ncbi:alpha/beta fold hydrolase [Limosilactobacillus caecicola]|uniref:alpha/beta fold hydrolase n=1 Tax=Limosilactobacillus caecicola TaxID=2941332 RepID=UPI00203DBA51|nr:hypothetical protein [Limosilactobacillus caecicola]
MGTVIVLPAFNHDSSMWQQVSPGHRDLQIIDYHQFELPEYTFEYLVQAVVEVVKQAPQPVILAGEDFGALVALRASVDLLGRLDRLLLVRPHYQATNSLLRTGVFGSRPIDNVQYKTLKKSLVNVDLTKKLMHIQGATFIFTGDQDRKNKQVALDLKNRLLDGHLTIVPKMGKELNTEGVRMLNENLR